MFKRVIYEEWAIIIVISSFAVVACAFLISTIRAFCLPKTKREHLANLPLEEDGLPPAPTDNSTPLPPKP
jgi:hypothetical protein